MQDIALNTDLTSLKANPETRLNKLSKRLRREVGQAIADFNMIEEGDKIMVCLSGGKDSYTLLDILCSLQKYAPVNFELIAVNLDQQQPGFPKEVLPNYLESIGVPYRIINEDTYSVVKRVIAEGKTTCSLCSRLRRGILYRVAQEEKCTKIALGHHRDDMIETMFLNMFFAGKMKTMPAKLVSDNGLHTVIRPLAYCREKDIEKYSALKEFPIIPCNLCGSQPNLQRATVKSMLKTWDRQSPGRIETIFKAMQDISLSHMLDRSLYDFTSIASLSQEKFNPLHGQEISPANFLASRTERQAKPTIADLNTEQTNEATTVAGKTPQPNQTSDFNPSQISNPTHNSAQNPTNAILNSEFPELSEDELDKLAADELFGSEDYAAMDEKIRAEQQAELGETGLKIKQLS